jgi:hypothetical protein
VRRRPQYVLATSERSLLTVILPALIAPATNRRVLGSMNEFACHLDVRQFQISDLIEMAVSLSGIPMSAVGSKSRLSESNAKSTANSRGLRGLPGKKSLQFRKLLTRQVPLPFESLSPASLDDAIGGLFTD